MDARRVDETGGAEVAEPREIERRGPNVILVLEDDDCVYIYQSAAEVEGQIEALDADDVIRSAFDDSGRRYRIQWIKPNRISKGFFGYLRHAHNGAYRLVESGSSDIEALIETLRDAREIFPESAREEVRKLQQRLSQ